MRFITRLFALLGVVTVLLVVVIAAAVIHRRHAAPAIADGTILNITITGALTEKAGFDPFNLDHAISMREMQRALRGAAKDSRIKGVFLDFTDNLPLAQAEELHASVAAFRQSGKKIYAFADTFGEQGPGAGEYYLAAACDKVWLQPMGMVGLMGIGADEFFLKDFFARNGVVFEENKREQYKTAFDNFSENGFTPANREMTTSLMKDLLQQIVTGIAADRKIDQQALRDAIDIGPISADKAKGLHLIDEIDYPNDALDALETEVDADDTVSVRKYLDALPQPAPPAKNKIALIYTDGELMRHASGSPLDDTKASDPREVLNAFRKASEDDDVKAIVFRINSPGGSVIASETIHGGLLMAQDAGKPVIVSMGEMAGSGGYWIAADADWIIAEPATLTGSIGVLGGKPVIQQFAKDHGINTEAIGIGQNANMDSIFRPLTPEQQAKDNEMLDDIYGRFKDVVADGRKKLTPEKVEDIAKGRVYTGQQALGIGLVDELGGLDAAFTRAKERADLSDSDKVDIVEIPAAPNFADFVRTLLTGEDTDDDVRMPNPVALQQDLKLAGALRWYLRALTASPADRAVLMTPGLPTRE